MLSGSFLARGQQSVVDSLHRELALHENDSLSIRLLSKLASEFSRTDLSMAKAYVYRAIATAKRLDTDFNLSACYSQMTTLHQQSGQLDSARYYLEALRRLSVNYPNENDILANYHITGGLFFKNKGELEIALDHMLKALDYLVTPAAELTKAGQYLNIGNLYLNQGNLRNAAAYHLNALRAFEKLGNKRGQSFCLQSLGNDFLKLKRYEESRQYYEQSLALKTELNDMRGVVSTWIGLGNVSSGSESFVEAVEHYSRALAKARELNLTRESMLTLFDLAMAQKGLDDVASARSNLTKALDLARQHGDSLLCSKIEVELTSLRKESSTHGVEELLQRKLALALRQGDRAARADAYLQLSEWNFENKKYEKAFEMLKLFHRVNDSVRGEEVILQLKRFEELYNDDKKEQQIALLKKEQELQEAVIARQKANQRIILIVVGSVLVIAVILINQYRIINRSKRLIEIEKVRNSIARDLHDDVGSALSSIHIMSQVAMTKSDDSIFHLQRISENASRMMERMSDIVWSINPGHDSLEQLLVRMKEFAAEMLESKNIRYTFVERDDLSDIKLDLDTRKNLFLIYKESINNAAKYSEGTEVTITLGRNGGALSLSVRDNGKGFVTGDIRNGNGLSNMKERARVMKGRLVHTTAPGKGTEVLAELPVT